MERASHRLRLRTPPKLAVAALVTTLLSPSLALGNPTGPAVIAGQTAVTGVGTDTVTINQASQGAILSWQSFNIAPGEVTQFVQPNAQAIALNRILDQNPSQILGSLTANGQVILLNPNGILFGEGAQVNVNGLVASALDISSADFLAGRLAFSGAPTGATVENHGTIESATGGFVYLFAPNVENTGIIRSPEGHVVLAAGTAAFLSSREDGRGFLVRVEAPTGQAVNLGEVVADAGRIGLYGTVVNQGGLVRADSVRERDGRIELIAGERLVLGSGSRTSARGGEVGVSSGGTVIARSDMESGRTVLEDGAVVDVSGGAEGGHGGFVEVSGHDVTLDGTLQAHAAAGFLGGRILVDPYDVTLDLGVYSGTGASEITVQADNDIVVASGFFRLGDAAAEGTLTLEAGNDIRFQDGVFLTDSYAVFGPDGEDGARWNLSFTAGRDIVLCNDCLVASRGAFDPTAGGDIVSPGLPISGGIGAGGRFSGLTVYGGGTLNAQAGRHFLGRFNVIDGDALVRTAGDFGRADAFGHLALGTGRATIDAGGSVYLGRAEQAGSFYDNDDSIRYDPGNELVVTARTGDVYLDPSAPVPLAEDDVARRIRQMYPASLVVEAPHGDIVLRSSVNMLPSPSGSLVLRADGGVRGEPLQGSQGGQIKIAMSDADPSQVIGSNLGLGELMSVNRHAPESARPADGAEVTVETENGDIDGILFDFRNIETLTKTFSIRSGADIVRSLFWLGGLREGDVAMVHGRGNIIMRSLGTNPREGIFFFGPGTGQVVAEGNLDLGDTFGIVHQLDANDFSVGQTDVVGLPGALDVSVGGNLSMTSSRIFTRNGASISIHGVGGADSAVGGTVDVGTNVPGEVPNDFDPLGIGTAGGGDITIRATGDVNVNASRIYTALGGDIAVSSLEGDINAGFGSGDATTEFAYRKPDGTIVRVSIPGSGIFTVHVDDPNPLPPVPQAPNNALFQRIVMERFLGKDVSDLEAQYNAQYEALLDAWAAPLKLGDITLEARSGSVIVPPAGIRGRRITIEADTLDLQGGTLSGVVRANVARIHGAINITGAIAIGAGGFSSSADGGSAFGGLSGGTGALSSATSSAATTAEESGTAAEERAAEEATTEEAQAAAEEATQQAALADDESRSGSDDEVRKGRGRRGSAPRRFLRIKRGVVIEVDVTGERS